MEINPTEHNRIVFTDDEMAMFAALLGYVDINSVDNQDIRLFCDELMEKLAIHFRSHQIVQDISNLTAREAAYLLELMSDQLHKAEWRSRRESNAGDNVRGDRDSDRETSDGNPSHDSEPSSEN